MDEVPQNPRKTPGRRVLLLHHRGVSPEWMKLIQATAATIDWKRGREGRSAKKYTIIPSRDDWQYFFRNSELKVDVTQAHKWAQEVADRHNYRYFVVPLEDGTVAPLTTGSYSSGVVTVALAAGRKVWVLWVPSGRVARVEGLRVLDPDDYVSGICLVVKQEEGEDYGEEEGI